MVLVVEDNPVHAGLFTDLLESDGYATTVATTGMEAIDLIRRYRPDVVLMDVQLPDISGLEVTRDIKADEELKRIPIIAVTAFASSKTAEKMRDAGCSDFLTKPVSGPDFLDTVARVLRDFA